MSGRRSAGAGGRIRAGVCAALLLAVCSVAEATAIASLLRVTVDGQPADAEFSRSYGVETTMQRHLGDHGFNSVDLTPIHSDFQKLRYTRDCPIVDGASSLDDCAGFGDYSEAVLHALDSIRMGVEADMLQGLGPGDLVLVGEFKVFNESRQVRGELHYRLYSFENTALARSDDHQLALRISSRATRQGITSELFDRVIEAAVISIADR